MEKICEIVQRSKAYQTIGIAHKIISLLEKATTTCNVVTISVADTNTQKIIDVVNENIDFWDYLLTTIFVVELLWANHTPIPSIETLNVTFSIDANESFDNNGIYLKAQVYSMDESINTRMEFEIMIDETSIKVNPASITHEHRELISMTPIQSISNEF